MNFQPIFIFRCKKTNSVIEASICEIGACPTEHEANLIAQAKVEHLQPELNDDTLITFVVVDLRIDPVLFPPVKFVGRYLGDGTWEAHGFPEATSGNNHVNTYVGPRHGEQAGAHAQTISCPDCNGSGSEVRREPVLHQVNCITCGGKGQI